MFKGEGGGGGGVKIHTFITFTPIGHHTNCARLPFKLHHEIAFTWIYFCFSTLLMSKVCRHVFVIFPVNLATCFWTSYDNRLFKCESRSDVSLSTAIMQKWYLLDFEWLNNFSVKISNLHFADALTNPNESSRRKGQKRNETMRIQRSIQLHKSQALGSLSWQRKQASQWHGIPHCILNSCLRVFWF